MNVAAKRVIIIDDRPSTRVGVVTRLALESDLEVVGEASDFAVAIRSIGNARPNVAVIDISLKTSSGSDSVKALKKH